MDTPQCPLLYCCDGRGLAAHDRTTTNTGLGSSPESPQMDAITEAAATDTGESRPDTEPDKCKDCTHIHIPGGKCLAECGHPAHSGHPPTKPEQGVNEKLTPLAGSDWLDTVLAQFWAGGNDYDKAKAQARDTINARFENALDHNEVRDAAASGEYENGYDHGWDDSVSNSRKRWCGPTQVTGDET